MKNIIILAAGVGSRLRPLTNSTPKSCIKVGDKSLIARLITQLHQFAPSYEIFIVGGYRINDLRDEIETLHVPVTIVENNEYASTNNMESCRLALEHTALHDTIIINADCIYDDRIIQEMVGQTSSVIAIDSSTYEEENMKVRVDDNRVHAISKQLADEPNHMTSIDCYHFLKKDASALLAIMQDYNAKGDLGQWTEVAINELLSKTHIGTVDFNGLAWVEIDNNEDLSRARSIW